MTAVSYPIEMVNGVPVVAAPEEIDATNADWFEAVVWQAHYGGHATRAASPESIVRGTRTGPPGRHQPGPHGGWNAYPGHARGPGWWSTVALR